LRVHGREWPVLESRPLLASASTQAAPILNNMEQEYVSFVADHICLTASPKCEGDGLPRQVVLVHPCKTTRSAFDLALVRSLEMTGSLHGTNGY
jgi:hypothetical protein